MTKGRKHLTYLAALTGTHVTLAFSLSNSGAMTMTTISTRSSTRSRSYTGMYASNNGDVSSDNAGPDPLVVDGDWAAYLDAENTGLVYYFNEETNQSLWEKPYPTFPDVNANIDVKSKFKFGLSNIFSGNTVAVEEEVVVVVEEDTTTKIVDKSSLFGGMFGTKSNINENMEVTNEVSDSTASSGSSEDSMVKAGSSMFRNMFKQQSSVKEADVIEEPTSTVKKESKIVVKEPATISDEMVQTKSRFASIFNPPASSSISARALQRKETVGLEVVSRVVPHPEKVSWGGEDAVFAEGRTFGVFDGVSGAEKEDGKDLYSNTLAEQYKLRCTKGGKSMKELTELLKEVSDLADSEATGASTALVANVDEDNTLRVLNVGDCRLIVIRDGIISAKTKEIVHYFDCPYQLSVDSPDKPKDGTKLQVQLMKGDIVIAGSDGIFDNITEKRICKIVNANLWSSASSSSSGITRIAKMIADEARKISFDPNAETPYAVTAKRYYEEYSDGVGGKLDDVSCIVARCT